MKKTKHSFRIQDDTKPILNSAEIAKLRKNILNISQSLFAELIGVTPRAVTSWECGWRKPSAATQEILRQFMQNPSSATCRIGDRK